MRRKENSHNIEDVVRTMSYAGISALVVDRRGKIAHTTGAFQKLSGDGASGRMLSDLFDGSPDLESIRKNGESDFTVRSSGIRLKGKIIRELSPEGETLIVFRPPAPNAYNIYAGNDLVFQFDVHGKVYYASENVEKITGYTQADFISGRLKPLDIVHPDDRERLERDFDDLFVRHRSVEGSEHRIVRKDGSVAYLTKSWYSLLDSEGRFNGVIGLNRDITDEKVLRERLELFRSAFAHATDGIVITDVHGTIVEVNDAFTRIYGYTRDETIGRKTSIVQSRHSTAEFYGQMWDSLEKNGEWRGEIINRRKDGAEIPIWLSITPIFLGEKKIGYMGIGSDISDMKDLEQQIVQTEKLATIGQLAAGIAHEIGTPLNIISGNAEYMLLDMKNSDKGYQELTTIIAQTRRMTKLMRQLLDFARPKILSLQAVEVNSILKEVLDFVSVQFKKSSISIKTELDRKSPRVYGDPALLYQVFLNIVVNAFQAMPKGGNLTIRTAADGGPKAKKRILVIAADTGEGIHPEHMDKLFTPFFTTKEPGKGTGLGLAVTKRIVQEHGGEIDIKSRPGEGTVVTMTFDAFRPPVAVKEE